MSAAVLTVAVALLAQLDGRYGASGPPVTPLSPDSRANGAVSGAGAPASPAGQPSSRQSSGSVVQLINNQPSGSQGAQQPGSGTVQGSGAGPFDRGQSLLGQTGSTANNLSRPPNSGATATTAQNPPLTGQVPAQAAPITPTMPSAKELMASMLQAPQRNELSGSPVRLQEIVSGSRTREEQVQRIDAYWDLCSAVADYYLSVHEQGELAQLRRYVTQRGAAWQQAEEAMNVRTRTSLRAAQAAQYRLVGMMNSASTQWLPLPGDPPHCGDYHSRYDDLFAGRESTEARLLAELLPLRLAELKKATTDVTAAKTWLDQMVSQSSGQASDGTGVLFAFELLAVRRRAFVQIAKDYNRRIARYTELSTPGLLDTQRLVAMLVRQPGSGAGRQGTQTATAPGRQNQGAAGGSSAGRTFQGEWGARSPVRKRTGDSRGASTTGQTEQGQERSVLVGSR